MTVNWEKTHKKDINSMKYRLCLSSTWQAWEGVEGDLRTVNTEGKTAITGRHNHHEILSLCLFGLKLVRKGSFSFK